VHGQLLAAFKAAAPRLGFAPRLVHALDWLFKFTQPQDWGKGTRPIVWPSAAMQQAELGLSPSQVKATNRELIEAGLISMKDSPNGKRYGKREHPKGPIVEAYGFDLSPLAARYAEFVRLAGEAKAERAELGRLRRRATIARNGIAQILETATEYGLEGDQWLTLARESRDLGRALRKVETPEEMALGVESLERRQRAAREALEILLAKAMPSTAEAVDSGPKGPEIRPHQYTYKPNHYPFKDTVTASGGCRALSESTVHDPASADRQQDGEDLVREIGAQQAPDMPIRPDAGPAMKLSTDELTLLAPRLRSYLKTPTPNWREIIDAADWLRGELGVSKSLWGEACIAMGRESAAIAIAIVSAKPADHFRTTPGGYFHGMVAKAKAGELNLARTIWGLRDAARPNVSRAGQRPRPGSFST